MPNYARADWSPVADAIKGFGGGLVNNALKKYEMQRQLGKDRVSYDQAQAAIDLSKAKTAAENFTLNNRRTLAGQFDPTSLTGDERTAAGIAAMLGGNNVSQILNAAKTRQQTRQLGDLYASRNPQMQVTAATGRAVMPYSIDSKSGTVLNRLTGDVRLNDIVKKGVETLAKAGGSSGGGTGGAGSLANIIRNIRLFTDGSETYKDPFTNSDRHTTFRNPDQERAAMAALLDAGIDMSDPLAVAGFLSKWTTSPAPTAPAVPVSPAPGAPEGKEPGFLSSILDSLFGSKTDAPSARPAPTAPQTRFQQGAFRSRDELIEALTNGLISEDEFAAYLGGVPR